MKKLKVIKKLFYKDKLYLPDTIIEVENNDAHTLVDNGYAELPLNATQFKENIKMMMPDKRKGYKTK